MREPRTVPPTEKTSKSLLLVEDDPALRESLFEHFERRGWHLTAVGTADEAIGLVGRGALYDVVLTDITMPGRLDGIDLARCILQERPTARVIVMSGYTARAAELKEVVSKGARFLPKPFQLRGLDAVIEGLLDAGLN
jgi:CheY-like chemotaxis protein